MTVDQTMTAIMNEVRTSSLNVAMVSTLSHNEYVVTNPIKNIFSDKRHKNGKEVGAHAGTLALAHIAQAGIAYFDLHKLSITQSPIIGGKLNAYIKKEKNTKTSKEENDDDEADDEDDDQEPATSYSSDKDKIHTTISVMVSNKEIPKVEELHKFLKAAFNKISDEQFPLFQSILQDIYVLQDWTRPLDWKEEHEIMSIQNSLKAPEITDLTYQEDEEDDGISIMKFKPLKSTTDESQPKKKTPVQTNKAAVQMEHTPSRDEPSRISVHSTSGKKSAQNDERERTKTPTSYIDSTSKYNTETSSSSNNVNQGTFFINYYYYKEINLKRSYYNKHIQIQNFAQFKPWKQTAMRMNTKLP